MSETITACVCCNFSDSVGQKLVGAFTWNMSGIDVNSTTAVGRYISTLAKTLTTIGNELDDSKMSYSVSASPSSAVPHHSPKTSAYRRGRVQSYAGRSDEFATLRAMELDLARQTRKLQKLRFVE